MAQSTEVAVCSQCGFAIDSREHIEGRGNIHNPDFSPLNKALVHAARKVAMAEAIEADIERARLERVEAALHVVHAEGLQRVVPDAEPVTKEERIAAAIALLTEEGIIEATDDETAEPDIDDESVKVDEPKVKPARRGRPRKDAVKAEDDGNDEL